MKWFDIIKEKKLDPQAVEEQVRRERIENIYGIKTNVLLGSLKPLNDLRGDYSRIKFSNFQELDKDLLIVLHLYDLQYDLRSGRYFTDAPVGVTGTGINYFITMSIQIRDDYRDNKTLSFQPNIELNDIKKYMSDWVEIWNQPNHRYKNIYAKHSLSDTSIELFKKYIPLDDITNITSRGNVGIFAPTKSEDTFVNSRELDLNGKTYFITEGNAELATILQKARGLK